MPSFSLVARAPFDFLAVVKSHGWYQLTPFAWDEDALTLNTVLQLHSNLITPVAITGEPGGVRVSVPRRVGKPQEAYLRAVLGWMFNLEADYAEFYALADKEPRLAHCRPKAYGRLLRSGSLWEDVVKVMLTTNIQWAGTKRLAAQLVNYFGEPWPGDSALKAFPTAKKIARSRESTLRKLGLGYRAPYLLKLARGVASGEINLASLLEAERPTLEVRKDLLALPGIGPYAAATLLGFLGRYDFIGVDTEAVSAVSNGFFGGQPVGEKEINAVFERWGKYKALAFWFWDYAGEHGD
ncbi:MAG: hypothetical protein JNL09_05540 [Anaerolineales bacterium]|nr:hypothetical protein [Anaerolineales bacterium]